MKPEVAPPVKRIQISLTGGAEPLPYGCSHIVRYDFSCSAVPGTAERGGVTERKILI